MAALGLVADVPAGLQVVCQVMVTRKGSCRHLSMAFKCWVRNLAGYFMPTACLPGLGARGCLQGAPPTLALEAPEFPSHALKLRDACGEHRLAEGVEESCHHPCPVE